LSGKKPEPSSLSILQWVTKLSTLEVQEKLIEGSSEVGYIETKLLGAGKI